MKRILSAILGAAVVFVSGVADAQTTSPPSVIPPIVLQGCGEKVKPHHAHLFANNSVLSGSETGDKVVGFDLSFVNTTNKVAKIVMVRIGDTDFTKIGQFSPDAVIAWRVAARPGACEVRAVRFEDGTEWSLPPSPVPVTAPAAAAPDAPGPTLAPTPAPSPQ
jgi:hypothetical protein